MSSSPPLPMRGLSENLGRGALLPSCPPQMKLVYCELTAQTHKHCHITPRLTAASPEPLALSVPKLQAADPPPPWSEQHVYSLCIEAAGSNCLRRGWQVGRRNGSGDRQAAASLPLHVRGSQVLWIPPLHPEVVRSAAGCTATSRPGPLQSLLTESFHCCSDPSHPSSSLLFSLCGQPPAHSSSLFKLPLFPPLPGSAHHSVVRKRRGADGCWTTAYKQHRILAALVP